MKDKKREKKMKCTHLRQLKKWINVFIILFITSTGYSQTDTTDYKLYNPETRLFELTPEEDAVALDKKIDEHKKRKAEIVDWYDKELEWLRLDSIRAKIFKNQLLEIGGLMKENSILKKNVSIMKPKLEESKTLLKDKDIKIENLDKARKNWKTAAIATPVVGGAVWGLFKYIIIPLLKT